MKDATSKLLPIEAARDSVESLAALHGGGRPWIYWLILAGVAGALGSLPLIKVDVSVRAPGVIRPATDRAEVRPSVSGHVIRVLVHDNDRVSAGQPLLVLASHDLDERLARNRAMQSEHGDLIDDLQLLTAPRADQNRPDTAGVSLGALKATTGFKTEALHGEHAQLLAQLGSNELDAAKARIEYQRYATLSAKGVASRSDLDRTRYEVERLHADAVLIGRQALARWQERLRQEDATLADLVSEETRLRGELAHFTIRAPVEGMLIGFTGWSAGGFVSAGQLLGAVSPNDTLLVDSMVSPRDIGQVGVGQPAKIQVDAFPYTQWGLVDGTVLAISADALGTSGPEAASLPWFKVVVRPAVRELRLASGIRGRLRRGLTVQTRFLVARRSLFQLLSGNAGSWLNPEESLRNTPSVHP